MQNKTYTSLASTGHRTGRITLRDGVGYRRSAVGLYGQAWGVESTMSPYETAAALMTMYQYAHQVRVEDGAAW